MCNYLRCLSYRLLLIFGALVISGCSSIYIEDYVYIEHEYGEIPKLKIELPPDCGEVRIRGSNKRIMIKWEKKINL